MVHHMNYRQFLIDRKGRPVADNSEPRILDYLSLRNRDAANAWHMRLSRTAQASSPDLKATQIPQRRSKSKV